MKTKKNLGICMDHASANLMEFEIGNINTIIIASQFTHQVKEESLQRGENGMHTKENHFQTEYYNKIGDKIKNYDEVLLFGQTNAKDELYNILKADNQFDKIKIHVKPTDKLTVNQQHALVKEQFNV